MKTFILKVAQNGGEYHGYTTIKANDLRQEGYKKVIADGIEIEFDEYIAEVKEKDENLYGSGHPYN